MTDTFISWLTDPVATDPGHAGGKGANLAALAQAGLLVPAGFVVSTHAYDEFVGRHHLDKAIATEIARLGTDPDSVHLASARLRHAFDSAPMSDAVREEIVSAYRALGAAHVAVRSSATAEDLPEASFAGQQDTVLNVTGADALCDAVRRCWSSLWSARAIAYRRDNAIRQDHMSIAVVVQPMIAAETAGVLFTADPLTGRRDRVVIEAAPELGEAVVSGRVTPDRWILDPATRGLLSAPHRELLTTEQLDALVALGTRAATVFGGPQDIEWAIDDTGRCWLLQCRPITSLFPIPAAAGAGLRVYIPMMLVAQGIAEPMTPMGNTFFREMVGFWFRLWISGHRPRAADDVSGWMPVVADRLFLDITPVLQRRRLAGRVVANLGMKDPIGSAALRDWLQQNGSRLDKPSRRGVPGGVITWLPAVVAGVAAAIATPGRARRRLVADADSSLISLENQAEMLTAPEDQLRFVERELPAATCEVIVRQLPPAYAEWLLRTLVERLVRRWRGSSPAFEQALRWLPYDPTVAMGAALARVAREHAAAGRTPTPDSPGIAEFLVEFGHRAPDREVDLGLPRLRDDPTYVVELINGYLNSEAVEDFHAGAEQARAAAETLVDGVRAGGAVRAAVLADLLERHLQLGGLRERPKFDMVRAIAVGRRTLQRCGGTLVTRGLLDDADDIFFLDVADVRAALAGRSVDLRQRASANRRSYRRELRRRSVPRVLTSEGEAIYGSVRTPAAGASDVLVGTPLSPGVHQGIVRVLDSPVGADLQPGDVVVAASTDPGWTPLFLLAGALVMEVGGVVSHGALVAREYGIPAVAGIENAMDLLHTGQRVSVNGNDGSVTVLAEDGGARDAETRPGQPSC